MCGAKEWRALAPITNKTNIWCRFTYRLQFWIMTGIFYSWDRSIFQYQTMSKSSVELGLVYKTFVNKHTCETPLLPRKTNCIHCSRNAGFFWEAEQGYISLTTKNTSLERFFPSESCAVLPDEARWWARSCSRSGVRFSKLSLANYGRYFHWTQLVKTELATTVAFGKRTPDRCVHRRVLLGEMPI